MSEPWPPPAHPGYDLSKRAIDLLISSLVLVIGAPVWAALAALIRATSPGPALHKGQVAGHNGRIFTYYKFRSMRPGDDSHHREWLRAFVMADSPYATGAGGTAVYKVVDDPRITRVGHWIRRFSIDEVPQLINVLRGEMSIVGPRPPLVAEVEHYDERSYQRLAVLPGITGLYQVTARSQVPFSEMLAIDCDYIRRRSLALDLWIMARTVGVMLGGRGAR